MPTNASQRKVKGSSAARKRAPSPFSAFSRLESDRQSEWLFNRHRPKHPAWKKD
jgi:hypothetical protein